MAMAPWATAQSFSRIWGKDMATITVPEVAPMRELRVPMENFIPL